MEEVAKKQRPNYIPPINQQVVHEIYKQVTLNEKGERSGVIKPYKSVYEGGEKMEGD